jgi:hypothetical protein
MPRLAHGPAEGQETDLPEPRTRCSALKLSPEETTRLRIATRKVAKAVGGFRRLACLMEVPPSTVYHAARVKGRASGAFAIRLAAVAKVPVEMILTGKLAVQPPVIGVAA